jgi:hypothetical protein
MIAALVAMILDRQAPTASRHRHTAWPVRNSLAGHAFTPMHETTPQLVEASFRIAWDYLAGVGELEDYDIAARLLLDTIENMIRQGERRRLLIANKAIGAYQRARAERYMAAS